MINEHVKQQLGGLHSAKLFLYSVDFYEIEKLQMAGDWQQAGEILGNAANALARAGAEVIVVCTNTMHKVADDIERIGGLPLLHIADATAEKIKGQGLRKIGLLGTRFTMEQDFYRGRLVEKYALDVLVPESADREIVHRVIYDELVLGKIESDSKAEYLRIIAALAQAGAEGIILGCTEIGLLVSQADCSLPLFDTTRIHADAAVEWALR